jgi:hypothetical protein
LAGCSVLKYPPVPAPPGELSGRKCLHREWQSHADFLRCTKGLPVAPYSAHGSNRVREIQHGIQLPSSCKKSLEFGQVSFRKELKDFCPQRALKRDEEGKWPSLPSKRWRERQVRTQGQVAFVTNRKKDRLAACLLHHKKGPQTLLKTNLCSYFSPMKYQMCDFDKSFLLALDHQKFINTICELADLLLKHYHYLNDPACWLVLISTLSVTSVICIQAHFSWLPLVGFFFHS